MSPVATATLYVEGKAVGAEWQFRGMVHVLDPETGDWRRANPGEVLVELIEYHWGILPDRLLDSKNTDANGDAYFDTAAKYPPAGYLLKATHNTSQDTYGVLLETHEDGSWEVANIYENL